MTRQTSLRLLWATLLLCVPIPYFLVETGVQPTLAVAQLLAASMALIAIEGGAGVASVAIWLLAAQVLIAGLLLRVAARTTIRVLDRVAAAKRSRIVVALVLVMFSVCATVPIYRTPFRTAGLHATLREAFE